MIRFQTFNLAPLYITSILNFRYNLYNTLHRVTSTLKATLM